MNSAFFAHAAQGAISKMGSEDKVFSGSTGSDKNGGYTINESDPAVKQSRDIASKIEHVTYTLELHSVFVNIFQLHGVCKYIINYMVYL